MTETAMNGRDEVRTAGEPRFADAVRMWFKIGLLSFGGPAGQIALMHREVVETRHWVDEQRFLHALNFCSLLPGPEAQQLATYLGWLIHGAKGGWVAGLAFILPGAAVMLVLSLIFVQFGDVGVVSALFFGLTCAVVAVVAHAVLRIAKKALVGPVPWLAAAAAFVALFVFGVPFPVVVLAAGLLGLAIPGVFAAGTHGKAQDDSESLLDKLSRIDPGRAARHAASARKSGILALVLWAVPVLLLLPVGGLFSDVAVFFSKMAVVTFGGAYAVLSYVAQQAVENYAWLTADEMLSGLGLAETTPGPLILVLEFVGFLAGYGTHGLAGAVLAALLTLWVTFAPCFAFVFLGAPHIERIQKKPRLAGALAGITAAVVGVIANMALWFGLRVCFGELTVPAWAPSALELPVLSSVDPAAAAIVAVAVALLYSGKVGVVTLLGLCSVLGILARLAF